MLKKSILGVVFVSKLFSCFVQAATPEPVFSLDFNSGKTESATLDSRVPGKFEYLTDVKIARNKSGRSAEFNGITSCIIIKNQKKFDFEKHFSLELWIKPKSWSEGQYQGLIAKTSRKKGAQGWMLYYAGYNNKLTFRVNFPNGAVALNTNPPSEGKWHHIAVTYRPGRLALYVDGTVRRTNPMRRTIPSNNEDLVIGKMYADKNGTNYSGEIDEIKIYDKTLPVSVIYQHSKMLSVNLPRQPKILDYPRSMYMNGEEKVASYPKSTRPRPKVIYFSKHLTPTEASEIATDLKSSCVNMVFPESYRYLFADKSDERNWFNSPTQPEYIKATKIMVNALHKRNIKFVAHLTSFCVLTPFFEKHKSWSMKSIRDGTPGYFPGYGTYLLCPNNDEFKNYYLSTLAEMVRATDVDGVMVDETDWFGWDYCACDYCVKKFKEETGLLPPHIDANFFKKVDNPIRRAWTEFRIASIGKFEQGIRTALNSIKPDLLYTACQADGLTRQQFNGMDVETAAQNGQNFLFYESEPSNPWSYLPNFVEAKYYSGFQRPVFQLQYNKSKSQKYFSWAFALSCGHIPWIWKTDIPRFFERKWGALLSADKCVADVGLVISSKTKNLYQNGRSQRYINEYIGWGEALTECHIPYDSLPTVALNTALLRKYSVIILPNTAILSSKQIAALREYTRLGGTIIATYETSLYDESGKRNSDFMLADVLGVSFAKKQNKDISLLYMDAKLKYEGKNIVEVKLQNAITKLCSSDGDIVCASNKFGLGTSYYLSIKPGLMCYMPKVGVGRIGAGGYWANTRIDGYRKMIVDLVLKHRKPKIIVRNAPKRVLINPLTFQSQQQNGLVIHILNCQGTKASNGVFNVPVYPDYEFTAYPPIKEPIQMEFQEIEGKNAYMISPDFNKIVKLSIVNKILTIKTIPRYAIIYIPGQSNLLSACLENSKSSIVSEMPQITKFAYVASGKTINQSLFQKSHSR